MKTIVLSLGGSLIVPRDVDVNFVRRFARLIERLSKRYKFVIVTGGGWTARHYIRHARVARFSEDYESLVGIESTRLNASLVAGFFRKFRLPPESFEAVRAQLKKEKVVVCGALGFLPEMTSDGDAALIARYVGAHTLVNLTNVKGLYTKDPKRRGSTLIQKISYNDFLNKIHKVAFRPGMHFVLDHKAAHAIKRHKIKTMILNGHDLNNVQRCLTGKSFVGTVIYG